MLIIVNSAFEEHDKQTDDEMATNDDTHLAQEIELALISVNTSINSSNGNNNESPIDGEDVDTSDNNTTNNTQTTAECDDKLLLHVNQTQQHNGSSVNEDDDDSNSKDNYDMNYDDYYQDENLTDELKRKHTEEYGLRDVKNPDEMEKLVNDENGVDLEDCDYYSDGETSGIENSQEDILKLKRDGDGIIANNHFIGLYFFPHLFYQKNQFSTGIFNRDPIRSNVSFFRRLEPSLLYAMVKRSLASGSDV